MTASFAISARGKHSEASMKSFLLPFPEVPVDSIFGFSDPCGAYGGRQFVSREISDADLSWMYDRGIGYRIPLQNTVASLDEFKAERGFLTKHHRKGNSLILARTRFIDFIRDEFPDYSIEASVIMRLNSVKKVIKALEIFDTVVPDPMWFETEKPDIPQELRHRVRLFANAGCMYTCPQRTCYGSFSKINLGRPLGQGDLGCSMNRVPRPYKESMYDFDVQGYVDAGYSRFKLLRSNGRTGC